MCGKVDHARRALDAGCDMVVAQGTEAGGHTGQVATMPLVPQIVDAVGDDIPVVAAGGIVDGRGLAAALALGADGVWMGTRFIATPEARGVIGYKDALLAAAEDGTVISRAFSGKTMRVLRNEYTQFFEDNPGELQPFPAQLGRSMQDGAWHLGGGLRTPRGRPGPRGLPDRSGRGRHLLARAGGRHRAPHRGRGRGGPGPASGAWPGADDRGAVRGAGPRSRRLTPGAAPNGRRPAGPEMIER